MEKIAFCRTIGMTPILLPLELTQLVSVFQFAGVSGFSQLPHFGTTVSSLGSDCR